MKQFNRFPRWLRVLVPTALISGCVAINAIAFTEIIRTFRSRQALAVPTAIREPSPSVQAASAHLETDTKKTDPGRVDVTPIETPTPAAKTSPTPPVLPATEPKYGHFPYPLSNPTDMLMIASYAQGEDQRYETLHPDAAAALLKMVTAARADGIWLVPASGFRTLEQQRSLFTAQVASKGTPEAAAFVSAPPGYSEHHTGYAVDLADGSVAQDYDISPAFADTPAYQWLQANAAEFGFELSFAEGNAQGISFEPWHWRYIGSAEAKALFYPPVKPDAVKPDAIEEGVAPKRTDSP